MKKSCPLGHFALTGLLLDKLLEATHSRAVTVTSIAERMGQIDFDDLMGEASYERWSAYGQSKLANLLFAYELQRRLEAAGASRRRRDQSAGEADDAGYAHSAPHPGVPLGGYPAGRRDGRAPAALRSHRARREGGTFYGPGGFLQRAGYPQQVRSSARSYDEAVARKLWAVSEELTGVKYAVLGQ